MREPAGDAAQDRGLLKSPRARALRNAAANPKAPANPTRTELGVGDRAELAVEAERRPDGVDGTRERDRERACGRRRGGRRRVDPLGKLRKQAIHRERQERRRARTIHRREPVGALESQLATGSDDAKRDRRAVLGRQVTGLDA
jgi:hypothetical protein